MEVDEVQKQVSKFQRVSSNGSTTTTDNNSSNPQKLATSRGNLDLRIQNHVGDGGGVARFYGWPSSRIVRVSRASGGKDRHSKVLTSKGLRDRRVRLSVGTAIQFYDLQDRLGFDQPSKAVEWLLKAAASSIDELPSLDLPIPGLKISDHHRQQQMQNENGVMVNSNDIDSNNLVAEAKLKSKSKSLSCSSTSETSKGESELSLSRYENRMKARERARLLALKKDKEKDKETDSSRVTVLDQVNGISDTSSFTDLLTGRSQIEHLFNRPVQASPLLFQMQQFNILNGENLHHFSFQDGFVPAVTPVGVTAGGERHNLNFAMTSPLSYGGGVVSPSGFTRGTLQSNLQQPILPHQHHLQRFQSSSIEGSVSTSVPFFIVPNATVDHFSTTGGYNFSYGGGGDSGSDHQKE